jgi:hypothetical protein
MNLRVTYNFGKLFSSCATGGFLRRAYLHGVSSSVSFNTVWESLVHSSCVQVKSLLICIYHVTMVRDAKQLVRGQCIGCTARYQCSPFISVHMYSAGTEPFNSAKTNNYIASSGRMSNELEWMWKLSVVVRRFPLGTEKQQNTNNDRLFWLHYSGFQSLGVDTQIHRQQGYLMSL